MCLLHTSCVPVITYGSQAKEYCSRDKLNVNVAVNDCIRKILNFNRWNRVPEDIKILSKVRQKSCFLHKNCLSKGFDIH